MPERPPFYAFKETRLSLEPSYLGSTIAIRLPAHGVANESARTPQRRLLFSDANPADDEAAFAKSNLASSGSIYSRKTKKYPRSFLWRVLEDGKVLSIQCVDLSKSSDPDREGALTLRLIFPIAIRPGGISFSDSEDYEPVSVFVLTTSNDLYTLTLRPDFFHKASATERNVVDWCKTYLSSSFSFRYPHRLVARSPSELLISLHDGGLLRLTKKLEDDGSSWIETFYNEGGWGSSLRSLIPWQGNHTVRYGSANLELTTTTSLTFSPSNSHTGQDYVFTVSLNHTFKAWNLSTGKICANRDLLDQARQPHEMLKYTIDPAQTSLLKIVNQNLRGSRDLYYLITYSPVDSGQFKFWAVGEGGEPELEVQDLFPDHVFEPPAPSSEIWTLSQFEVVTTAEPGILVMWILWKNNTTYRLQSLEFDLLRVSEDWQQPWTATATETLRSEPLPSVSTSEPSDPTDRWLEYIFYPGRYTDATLATSLSIYEQNLNVGKDHSARKTKNIKERTCTSVGSSVSLGRSTEGGMDFQRYRIDTDFQWRRFYRIVAEIDKQRGEVMSIAFDATLDIVWVILVDGVSAIRDCNDTEILWHNQSVLTRSMDGIGQIKPDSSLAAYSSDGISKMTGLLKSAAELRECFSDTLLHSCAVELESEILQDPSSTVPARMQNFYDHCNFAAHIGDDDYSQIMSTLDKIGGLTAIDTSLFESLVGTISQEKQLTNCDVTLTAFGEKTIVKGSQEMICLNHTILFDLLMLVLFLIFEDHPEDNPLGDLDGPMVYVALLDLLKEYSVLRWLSKTACSELRSDQSNDGEKSSNRSDVFMSTTPERKASSLLQYPWVRNWKPQWLQSRRSMFAMLSQSMKHVISDIGLSHSGKYKQQVMWMQRTLLRRGQYDLATEFLRYQPNTAWSVYLKGRLYLATKDYTTAALQFKKAAFNLAHQEGALLEVNPTEDILEVSDREFFNAGLPKYYSHIVSLFEKAKSFSFVVDFARIGLQFITSHAQDDSSKVLRTELLSRLFTACLQISSFDAAYSALLQYPNKALQRNALNHLLTTLCASPNPHFHGHLLRLPFLHLQSDVDALLAQKCRTTLTLHSSPPYHKILYAWRLQRGDYRGAAEVLHERLQRMKLIRDSRHSMDALARTYLALINTLAVVGEGEAWILAGGHEGGGGVGFGASAGKEQETHMLGLGSTGAGHGPGPGSSKGSKTTTTAKRRIVTIHDIRKEYQAELDRVAMIENDRFAFANFVDDDDDDHNELAVEGLNGRQDVIMVDEG
ncbi:MAG: hypothetical protein M1837_004354 [Sclerophora amabilis]|nr:MAG: hypothetical protein M1837_004354 [Sclerophora amabilis]